MATENVTVKDGRLVVTRAASKRGVDVSLSDVDSVSFTRGGEANGASDGALVLTLKDGSQEVIRVADDDAGRVLKLLQSGANKTAEKATASK